MIIEAKLKGPMMQNLTVSLSESQTRDSLIKEELSKRQEKKNTESIEAVIA